MARFRTAAHSSVVIFRKFVTARMLSSICPTVPHPQMATCTPGWLSAYRRQSDGLSDQRRLALPKILIAWHFPAFFAASKASMASCYLICCVTCTHFICF